MNEEILEEREMRELNKLTCIKIEYLTPSGLIGRAWGKLTQGKVIASLFSFVELSSPDAPHEVELNEGTAESPSELLLHVRRKFAIDSYKIERLSTSTRLKIVIRFISGCDRPVNRLKKWLPVDF